MCVSMCVCHEAAERLRGTWSRVVMEKMCQTCNVEALAFLVGARVKTTICPARRETKGSNKTNLHGNETAKTGVDDRAIHVAKHNHLKMPFGLV